MQLKPGRQNTKARTCDAMALKGRRCRVAAALRPSLSLSISLSLSFSISYVYMSTCVYTYAHTDLCTCTYISIHTHMYLHIETWVKMARSSASSNGLQWGLESEVSEVVEGSGCLSSVKSLHSQMPCSSRNSPRKGRPTQKTGTCSCVRKQKHASCQNSKLAKNMSGCMEYGRGVRFRRPSSP